MQLNFCLKKSQFSNLVSEGREVDSFAEFRIAIKMTFKKQKYYSDIYVNYSTYILESDPKNKEIKLSLGK